MSIINSYFKVADNSGVKRVKVIRNLSASNKRADIGDLVVGVIKTTKNSTVFGFSRVVYAVVIRVKTNFFDQRWNLSFNDNALILVGKDLSPLASRIFGVVPYVLKKKGYLKLNSLAVSFV